MSTTRPCQRCHQDFTYDASCLPSTGHEILPRRYCDICTPVIAFETAKNELAEKQRERELRWETICPPLYRNTDPTRLTIDGQKMAGVLSWHPNPRGVALAGRTGAGKTRLMFFLLHRLHGEGHQVTAITGKEFERRCHRMFDDHGDDRERLRKFSRTKILFIDDVGKEKYTERVESEFYDLIETRTANLLPILWTANTNGAGLKAMMSADRGEAILRRLREFTEIVTV